MRSEKEIKDEIDYWAELLKRCMGGWETGTTKDVIIANLSCLNWVLGGVK